MSDDERKTQPPNSPCPKDAPILDPGVSVIRDLIVQAVDDIKRTQSDKIDGQSAKIDALTRRVNIAIDESLVVQESLREASELSTRAIEISRDNQRRIEDIERRLNG